MRKNSGQQNIKHPNPFASTQNKPPTAGFVELVDEKMKKKPSNKLTAWKATKMAAKLKKNPEEAQAKITEKALQAFALAQYLERHMRLQSAMLTIFAFLLVGLGNLVADLRVGIAATAYGACLALMEQEHTVCEAHLVNSSHLPHDFLQKGTISNVAQDIASVEGRIWAVALLFASVGLLVSGYTFQLYRPWLYSDTDEERRAEAVVRAVWATFPQVGFMLTAAIPAMSGATGLQWAFGAIHNTMAPLAMLAIVTFETVQLSFGERAFTRFFGSAEEAHRIETELSHRGERLTPLVLTQKLRVLTLLVAWACGLTFVSLQVTGRHCHRHSTPPLLPPPPPPPHLLHHPSVQGYLAFCVNHSYVIALLSYGSEVGGTILAFLLPALAGIHHMCRKGKKNDVAGRIEREKLIKPEDDTSSSDDEPPPRIDPNRASLV